MKELSKEQKIEVIMKQKKNARKCVLGLLKLF
jgi:hypothetical protein